MPRRYSTREVERVLLARGFIKKSQKGSHVKYTWADRVVIVPAGRSGIRPGTLASILRQSGLSMSDFTED